MYVCAYNLREQSITIACAIGHKNKLLSTIQIKLLLKININDKVTHKYNCLSQRIIVKSMCL